MRRLALLFCGLFVAVLALPAAGIAYSWPLRPFYQPHAVRGYFNDPRLSGSEKGFHFGIDIVADDLTPVYAVQAGRASVRGHTVTIFPKAGGQVLSYWHVLPAVRSRQRVRRHQVIGRVAPGYGHLHLSEHKQGTYVNPLRIGGVAPYIDDTVPTIHRVTFFSFGHEIRTELVTGVVDVTVGAYDTAPLPLPPPPWAQAKLAPALIRWRIVQGQTIIRPWETAIDFRTFFLPMSIFDFVYTSRTFQNRPDRPGLYEYYVSHEFDSRLLPNGWYVLQVDALDTQENVGQASFAFAVTN